MTDTVPPPRYSIWQGLAVALSLGQRALEEVRAFIKEGGRPGPPGLGWQDMSLKFDGMRRFTFRFARGDQVLEETFVVRAMIFQGVYTGNHRTYEPGDVISYGGAMWHCDEETSDPPPRFSGASPMPAKSKWTLCVKAGRDGKDGKPGERGPEGKPGKDGDKK